MVTKTMYFLEMFYLPCVLAISKEFLNQIIEPAPKFDTVLQVAKQRFRFQKHLTIIKNGEYLYEEQLIKDIYMNIKISLQIFNYSKGMTSMGDNRLILGGSNLPNGYTQIHVTNNKSIVKKEPLHPFLVTIILLQRNLTYFEIYLYDPIKRSYVVTRDLNREYFSKKPNFYQRRVHFELIGEGHDVIIDFMKKYWNISAQFVAENADFFIQLSNEPFTDISLAGFNNYDTDYHIVQMCVVVQKGKEFPLWMEFYHYLSSMFFAAYLITILISSLILYFILWRKNNFFDCFFRILGIYFTLPSKWLLEIKESSLRLLLVGILLTSIVITNNLQSILFSLFQSPGRNPPKNKLEELKKTTILCTSGQFCKLLENIDTKNIYNSVRNGTIEDVYYNPGNALITRCSNAKFLLKSIPHLQNKLHIMTNLVGSYPIFQTSQFIPFSDELVNVRTQFYENGIIPWTVETLQINSLGIKRLLQNFALEVTKVISVLRLDDLLFAFVILVSGQIIALIVFLFELLYFKRFS